MASQSKSTIRADDPLTDEEIEHCQDRFNLSYHVHYSSTCQRLVGIADKDVLEVGGSLPEEFVLRYLKAKSWVAVETPDYDHSLREAGGITHQGTILRSGEEIDYRGFETASNSKYSFVLDNVENLPESYWEKFDLVFSIAAFEHIHRFPESLEAMYNALRPGGVLFTIFSPIWSGHNGHHLPEITDVDGNEFDFANSPIPPWGHLLNTPPQLYRYLLERTDKQTAAKMVYFVYNAPNINRYFTEDYLGFFNHSRFEGDTVELLFVDTIDEEAQARLQAVCPRYEHFTNQGMLAILRKGSG